MPACITRYLPIPVIEVLNPAELLHLVDCDGPADEVNHEGERVVPVIVAVQLFLAGVDGLLQGLQFALIEDALHSLHVLVLQEAFLVHLLEEGMSEDEREGQRGDEGDDCSPDDHGSAQHVVAVDGSDEDALDGPVQEDDGRPGKTGEELIMCEMEQRVERAAGPFVLLEVLVEDLNVDAVGDEEEEPVEEGPEPCEPQGNAFSEMSLELDRMQGTFPVVMVEA